MPVCLIVLAHDQCVARAALVHQHAVLDRRAFDVDDPVVGFDVLRTIRACVAVGAQPQIIFADLRDALFALTVAHVFDEAVRVRDGGRPGKRRIDAHDRAKCVTRRTHDAVRDVHEFLHVVGRNAALGCVLAVGIGRLKVRFEARILVPERVHVDDHVFHGLEIRHRIDHHDAVFIDNRAARRFARQTRYAVDVHRARAADGRTARAAEADRTVDFGFGSLQSVENGGRFGNVDGHGFAMRNDVGRFVEAENDRV